jgi:hypothetical protein
MKRLHSLALAALAAVGFNACLLEEKKEEELTPRGPYVLMITSNGENATDYLMTAKSLTEGVISPRRRGIEQVAWRYTFGSPGLYHSIGYYNDNNWVVYKKDPNDSTRLVEKGRFVFPVTIDEVGFVDTATAIAIEIPRRGFVARKFFRVDLNNVQILDTVRSHIYVDTVSDSLTAQPTSIVYRDGKVFVSFYNLHARGDFSTPNTDTAYVAIYNYPSFTLDKIIKSPTGGALGLYGNVNGLIKTASGDLFGYSCASRACFTSDTSVGHSKVVRIPAGQTEFDAAYEWDFQAATGKKLTWFAPIGGELAIGRAMTPSALEAAGKRDTTVDWVALGSVKNQELYILDLATKQAHKVTGVPVHGGEYGTSVYVENGKAYMNIVTDSEAYIYQIDIAGRTAVRGAKVNGAGIKMIAR